MVPIALQDETHPKIFYYLVCVRTMSWCYKCMFYHLSHMNKIGMFIYVLFIWKDKSSVFQRFPENTVTQQSKSHLFEGNKAFNIFKKNNKYTKTARWQQNNKNISVLQTRLVVRWLKVCQIYPSPISHLSAIDFQDWQPCTRRSLWTGIVTTAKLAASDLLLKSPELSVI